MLFYKENPNKGTFDLKTADQFFKSIDDADAHTVWPKLCSEVDVLAVMLANSKDTNTAVAFLTDFDQSHFSSKQPEVSNMNAPQKEHFKKATEIRRYYTNKLMMRKIKEGRVSKFRKHLYTLLNDQVNEVDQDHIKILCKIQEFYAYDMKLESIAAGAEEINPPKLGLGWFEGEQKLAFVDKAYRNTKRIKQWEYWFRDDQTKETYRMMFDLKNELLPLFNHYLEQRNNEITITGYFSMASLNGFPNFKFYNVNRWDFVPEK